MSDNDAPCVAKKSYDDASCLMILMAAREVILQG
jgi:hypothetical protein